MAGLGAFISTEQHLGILFEELLHAGIIFVLEFKVAVIFNGLFLLLLIPAAWLGLSGSNLIMFLFSLVFIGVIAGVFNWVVFRQEQKLQQVAVKDPLTHAYNRRSMMERLEHTIQIHQRYDFAHNVLSHCQGTASIFVTEILIGGQAIDNLFVFVTFPVCHDAPLNILNKRAIYSQVFMVGVSLFFDFLNLCSSVRIRVQALKTIRFGQKTNQSQLRQK